MNQWTELRFRDWARVCGCVVIEQRLSLIEGIRVACVNFLRM